jgi:hypothetical protein
MNLYEKIGRLIKHNKIFNLSGNNNEPNSKSDEESSIGLDLDNFESFLSDILSPTKLETKNIFINNKEFSKSDIEEAQNLIKKCSPDEQSILISILEIQLSLEGKENNYIKYEKINEKIIEKNIYWVITCEIHKRLHKKKTEFEEYCHCIKDQKEKYILGSGHNFKYENIDSIICKLKCSNKNIEFISIKSIYISFFNLTCEFIEKYIEIIAYNKKNGINEFLIFEYIINDYTYIIDKINFLNLDFKQSLECFISFFNIKFSFENLFKDIFFNLLFHNKIIGFLFIQGFIHSDSDIKKILKNILNLISDIKTPFCKNVGKILGVDNLMEIKCDLTTKILEQIEQLPICVGVGKCEIKNDEDNGEILRKKEIIYIRGKIGRKNNGEDKFDFSEKFPHLNMEKIFMDLNDDDNSSRTIIREKIIINKINKKERNDDNDVQEEKEKSYNKKENITNTNNDNNNSKNDEENNKVSINNNKNDTKSNTNREEEKIKDNKEKDKENFDNKSIEEIYEYINKDSKNKNKKKNKKRNKGRGKKNKNKNVNNNSESNDAEDPLVIQFKNDLSEELIFANSITKIKPYISENWIKTICA